MEKITTTNCIGHITSGYITSDTTPTITSSSYTVTYPPYDPIVSDYMYVNSDKKIAIEGKLKEIKYKDIDISEAAIELLDLLTDYQKHLNDKKPVPRPLDPIENVYFNYKKGVTTVKWKDGTVTTVRCQGDESFDEEKGLAMCFVKKQFDNRGCFNEIIKKWIVDGVQQGKISEEED